MDDPPAEIHIVNGLHPGCPFLVLRRAPRRVQAHQARRSHEVFTAVEIHFFAQHYGMNYAEVLERLRAPV